MKRSLWLAVLASLVLAAPASANCDNLDPAVCLQPFPNNYFTKPSTRTDTGLKVNFALTDMPRNAAGKPIQPGQWNRSDGFSPGSLVTTYVPGLDLAKTHGVPINDLARTYDKDAAVVVIDAQTLQRNLIWTEMDSLASSDSVRNLIIRPARNFREGHTYIVALRDLKDSNGATIPAGKAFSGYRDGTTSDSRSGHMNWIFGRLKKAGVKRSSLFLAWDFTVASERSLTERMLHIRDDAFAQLGDSNLGDMKIDGSAPDFKVSKVEPADGLARKVTGYFKVPCYISTPACQPGGGFVYKPGTNEPLQMPGNTYTAKFVCNIPDVALQTPGTASLYGHGLFGSTGELGQGQLKASGREHDVVFCGTTWAGMGCEIDDPPSDQQGFPEPAGRRAGGLERAELRHPERGGGDQRPVALQHDDRPRPGGHARVPVSGPPDGAPAGARDRSRVPERAGTAGSQDGPDLLRRQQPGRDHRRLVCVADGRQRPRDDRRARHELLDAAAALDRLWPWHRRRVHARAGRRFAVVRVPGLQGLSGRAGSPGRVRAHADAVGPRRGGRLRVAHDGRPVPQHAQARGADEPGLRRPSGLELGRGGGGADDGRATAHPDARHVPRSDDGLPVLRRDPGDPE